MKTLEAKVTKSKINEHFSDTIAQIVGNVSINNPTNNAYICLDFRNAPATNNQRDFLFDIVKERLK